MEDKQMAWRQRITDVMADLLRFMVRGALITNAIALAVASVYVTIKLCWFSVQWLDRVIFSHPW